MTFWFRLGLLSLSLFSFQNCGSFDAADRDSLYPFSTKPDFFYDLKLVSVETDEQGREVYEFDVALSFASDPNQTINYQLAFSTLDLPRVCLTQERSAQRGSNHERFTCILPTPSDLYIQLTLVGPTGEQETRQYRF